MVRLDSSPAQLRDQIRDVVGGQVDALICAPQGFAARALPTLAELGRRVGDDLQVVSLVADVETDLGDPRLTVVDEDPAGFGYSAMELMIKALAGEDVPTRCRQPSTIRWAESLT